jgi:hypothetical protein
MTVRLFLFVIFMSFVAAEVCYGQNSEVFSRLQASIVNAPNPASIRTVQEALVEMGLYKGKVDGLLGPQTRGLLIRLRNEAKLNLPESWSVGPSVSSTKTVNSDGTITYKIPDPPSTGGMMGYRIPNGCTLEKRGVTCPAGPEPDFFICKNWLDCQK